MTISITDAIGLLVAIIILIADYRASKHFIVTTTEELILTPSHDVEQIAWYVSGPSMSAVIFKHEEIEQYINAACRQTGDHLDDYTATKVRITVSVHPTAIAALT